jgi:hypothetical protein
VTSEIDLRAILTPVSNAIGYTNTAARDERMARIKAAAEEKQHQLDGETPS